MTAGGYQLELTRTEPDKNDDWNCWSESCAKLESPSQWTDFVEDQIRRESNENTECNAELESHHQSPTNGSWDHFGSHDGDGSNLDAHSNSHDQTAKQHPPPVLSEGLSQDREDTK